MGGVFRERKAEVMSLISVAEKVMVCFSVDILSGRGRCSSFQCEGVWYVSMGERAVWSRCFVVVDAE